MFTSATPRKSSVKSRKSHVNVVATTPFVGKQSGKVKSRLRGDNNSKGDFRQPKQQQQQQQHVAECSDTLVAIHNCGSMPFEMREVLDEYGSDTVSLCSARVCDGLALLALQRTLFVWPVSLDAHSNVDVYELALDGDDENDGANDVDGASTLVAACVLSRATSSSSFSRAVVACGRETLTYWPDAARANVFHRISLPVDVLGRATVAVAVSSTHVALGTDNGRIFMVDSKLVCCVCVYVRVCMVSINDYC